MTRFRLLDDVALPLLAAALESLWLGSAAALVVSRPPSAVTAPTLVVVACGTGFAVLGRRGARLTMLRLLLAATAVSAAGVLVASAHPPSTEAGVRALVRDGVAVSFALWLGIRAGRAPIRPGDALARSLRAVALVCALVLLARLADVTLSQSGVVVAAVILGGVVLVALARLDDVLAVVDRRHGVTAWSWFGGVVVTAAAVLLVAGLLAVVTHGGPLTWLLTVTGRVLGVALDAVAYVVALLGCLVMRGLSWLAGLAHLRPPKALEPHDVPDFRIQPFDLPERQAGGGSALAREVLLVVGTVVGGGAVLLALVGTLRRLRAVERDEVAEERESLLTTPEVLGSMRARLARLVPRGIHRARPATAAEALRREFIALEAALARRGMPRPRGATVRQYLAAQEAGLAGEAATLARAYEVARYSQHATGWHDVEAFRAARQRFVAAVAASEDPGPAGAAG